ncbi:MAG: tetratricopeptide repeat protein [Bacteroidales bacterium]|nr:tetratricopeptide repeat protein [Bacteroidales bacterium]
MDKKKDSATTQMENVESALTQAESFVLRNQKILTNVVLAVLVCAVGIVAIHRYYVVPRRAEAAVQMFPAERYFAADSLQLALNGDGNNPGFLDIIDEYGRTPSGKLANYYAGISYLNLGEYEKAAEYLKKYKGKDVMISSIAVGALGDAYAEMGNTADALSCYMKAAETKVNDLTAPVYLFRAGLLCEKLSRYDEALSLYQRIERDYPASSEGRDIEKYITRVQQLAGVK